MRRQDRRSRSREYAHKVPVMPTGTFIQNTACQRHPPVPAGLGGARPRLTSAGYAVRTRDPDDRRKVLFTTTEGDELASAARAQRNAWLNQRLQALSAEDRAVIARATHSSAAESARKPRSTPRRKKRT